MARADGSVDGQGLFVVKKNGKLLGGTGAPTLSFNFSDAPNANGDQTVRIAKGRAPRSGEVALDEKSGHVLRLRHRRHGQDGDGR